MHQERFQSPFDAWWICEGRYIDPDTADVSWFDKRKALAEAAFDAGVKQNTKASQGDATT